MGWNEWLDQERWAISGVLNLACDVFRIFLIATSSAGFVAFSLALSRVFSVHSWRSRRLHITIDVPLSYACSVCHPCFLGDMLHSAFINKMVQGGNIICPWSMFKTCVLNSFNNNVTEVIQTGWRVLKNRTGPAPDLWPRSMMMQKAFYDGWVDAAARAAGLPPPAAGCLGMKLSRCRKRVQQKRLNKNCQKMRWGYILYTWSWGISKECTAGSKYVDGFWTLQGQGL